MIELYPETSVVLISGKLMSGKSTTASDLLAWDRYSLAGPLKDDICKLCSVSREYMEKNKAMFRVILQQYGTDLMRTIHGDMYWVNRLKRDIINNNARAVVIDDCRFWSELSGFTGNAPYKVRLDITREEQVRRFTAKFDRCPDPSIFEHVSETALDDVPEEVWDVRVQVDGLTTLQVRDAILAAMASDGFGTLTSSTL